MRKTIATTLALICMATSGRPANAARVPDPGWYQLLAMRLTCRRPASSQSADPRAKVEGDKVMVEDKNFYLEWTLPADAPAPIRGFLLGRSLEQTAAIAACLRNEQSAGRWPSSPHEQYKRTAVWAHMDDRAGLQVWYLRDFDTAGPGDLYSSPIVWDVSNQRGLLFRELLIPERVAHFEGAMCQALRRHPLESARNAAPCPKLDQMDVEFGTGGCSERGFKIGNVGAWYSWENHELGLSVPFEDIQSDLRAEFRPHFGRVTGCPPPT